MTPQEQQMIDGLIGRMRSTPVQGKDMQAEQYIQAALGGTPDSLYVLVQTVLVQQYGLEQAQSQLNELKQQNQHLGQQLEQAQQSKSSGGSFLSHIFGSGQEVSASSQIPPSPPAYQSVNNGNPGGYMGGNAPPPPLNYGAQTYPGQSYPAPISTGRQSGMFGGGGFLQGALQTAAGVAAGEMMFQGMEDLFHGFGRGGEGRGFLGGSGEGETIVNNYYGENSGADRDAGLDDSGFYNPSQDASRQDGHDADQDITALGGYGDSAAEPGSGDNDFNDAAFDDGTADANDLGSDSLGGDDFLGSDSN